MSSNNDLRLAGEFAPASEGDWRNLVDGVLKGAPYDKLISQSYDAIALGPIYARAKGAAPIAGRAPGARWQIAQRMDHPDPKQANAQALQDLENGATDLVLTIAGSKGARGFGLAPTAKAIATALDGVHLEADIGIELDLAPQGREVALHVADLIDKRGLDPSSVRLRAGFDPIGAAAFTGASPQSWNAIVPVFCGAVEKLSARGFRGPLAVADGRVVHDSGGSEAQELAYVLACSVAYLRALEASGMPLDTARNAIFARLSADADQFLTIAKFRALRLLWARVENSCGLVPKPIFIAAETAWRMLTQRDPYVNLLRATMATFSAALGGANSITVLPHSLAIGLPDPLARRIARNTQLVLREEANLAKVSDPAAGSGGIEALTQQLCETAWELFQETEKAGGLFASLEKGLLQNKVAATRSARLSNIARRKDVLTGASEFPNLHELSAEVLPVPRTASPPPTEAKVHFDAFAPMRLAEPFEVLRDRSDEFLKQSGARPKVFLAELGTPADFTARATFARGFFEAGGIEAVAASEPIGNTSDNALTAVANGFRDSGAELVCLCSSDSVYGEQVLTAARALRQAGAKRLYLAGRPGEQEATYRTAGIAGFIFTGCDTPAILEMVYQNLEI